MAGFMLAVPVGVMLSFAVTGPLAQAYGWRLALAAAALPALVLLPAVLWLEEPPRKTGPAAGNEPGALSLLLIPAFRWIVISGAVVNFILYSFSSFIAAFLTRFHGLSVGQAGVWSGVGSGVAGILGAIAAGAWGDRGGGGPRARLALAGTAALAAAPAGFAGLILPAGRAAACCALLMVAYGLLQMYYGLVYAAIQDVVAPALRGTAMGVYLMAMYLCGGAFGPLLTGRLSDGLARRWAGGVELTEAARAAGLHQAMYVVPVLCVVLGGVLLAAGRLAGEGDAVAEGD